VPIILSFIHPESYYLQNPRGRYPQKILGHAIGEEYILCTLYRGNISFNKGAPE